MNLVSRVHETAMTQPEKMAYHFMGQDTSYAEFDQAVSKFASALQNLGVEKGDHVAFLLGNTPHFLISLYATMRLGATAIPVNPIYTPDEIYYILHNSDAKAVIALDLLLPLVEQVTDKFPAVEQFIICETVPETPSKVEALPDAVKAKVHLFTSLLNAGKPDVQPTDVDAGETAIILYTSGTTGQPKGAMLTHGNIYSNARDVADFLGFIEQDRVVATLPLFHVFALTVVVNTPLFMGATVLLVPRFSPADIFSLIKEQQASVFAGVPTMYNFLYQFPEGKQKISSRFVRPFPAGPHYLLHCYIISKTNSKYVFRKGMAYPKHRLLHASIRWTANACQDRSEQISSMSKTKLSTSWGMKCQMVKSVNLSYADRTS